MGGATPATADCPPTTSTTTSPTASATASPSVSPTARPTASPAANPDSPTDSPGSGPTSSPTNEGTRTVALTQANLYVGETPAQFQIDLQHVTATNPDFITLNEVY